MTGVGSEAAGAAKPRVGFVGLGSQGAPIARRICGAGFPTTLWARRAETLEPFAGSGAAVATSPASLGRSSEVVGVCVVNDDDVRSVLLGPDGVVGAMPAGGIVMIHSTVHPDTCAEVAERAADVGVAVVDAPVSGGAPAAVAGTLLVLVGGTDADVERVRPVIASFGRLEHVGPLGSGQMAKLVNNALMTAQLALADEVLAIGGALGLEPAHLAAAMLQGSGASYALGIRSRLPDMAAFAGAARLLRKDVDLLRSVAGRAGAGLGTIGVAAETLLERLGHPSAAQAGPEGPDP